MIAGALKSTSEGVVPYAVLLAVSPFPVASVEATSYAYVVPASRFARTMLCPVTFVPSTSWELRDTVCLEAEPVSEVPKLTTLLALSSVLHSTVRLEAVEAVTVGPEVITGN